MPYLKQLCQAYVHHSAADVETAETQQSKY